MSDKKSNGTADNFGLGEISTIRNILMGQQMSEYEQRFSHLEEKLTAASAQQGQNLADFQAEAKETFAAMEADMNARFDKLERMLNEGLDRLQSQTDENRRNDNEDLGRMLTEIGQALMKR